jgi:serine/threonine-protein kinase
VANPTARIGHAINQRYEIRAILGRGGQGTVYAALDSWMQRPVAIKVLDSKAARDPHTAERLIREQQALNSLQGTAAVEVLDICRGNDGELCLVMELLTGMDLDSYLYSLEERGERLPLTRVAELFDPIVDTLEVAHNAGILHRDLKPANVFVLDDGGVRLLDFGMARLKKAAPLTALGTAMGSPSFMAPEAWKGQPDLVDHRADVYSLGVILFRVLAGDLPFAGESLHEKFLGTTRGERPSLAAKRPDLPRDADDWVALALAIDREERFRNVRALWNAFLSTFDLESPKRRRGPSFWAAAKSAVKRIAGGGEPVPPAPGAAEHRSEPSFGRDALTRSVLNVQDPANLPVEPLVRSPADGPPRPRPPLPTPPPPPRPRQAPPPEPTVELTERDLRPVPPPLHRSKPAGPTIELSEGDLIPREDTLPVEPAAPRASPAADPPADASDPSTPK